MSLIASLPRVRAPKLPRADGLIPWIVPLVIILIWQVACVTGFVSARVLPAPSDVALAGWKLLLSGELVRNIWVSFWRASVGFLIGGSIGFAFGLANGLSQLSSRLTDTTLQMVRNIPHLALIPLVILWFGIDTFIMSGYPHLEEAYRFAELVFPLLSLKAPNNVTPIRINTGPFGETIANEARPLAKASQA